MSYSAKEFSSVRPGWLPFLNTYRTMCAAPEPAFKRVLEDFSAFDLRT